MLLFRDPFPLTNATALLNPESDRNTRVIVFVKNLNLSPDEPASSIVVSLVDENNQNIEVRAEAVRAVGNADFIQVIFRLPDGLAPGNCIVRIKALDRRVTAER